MIAAGALAAVYLWLGDRATRRRWPTVSWLTGCAMLAAAFSPPIEDASRHAFTAHMVEHLLIVCVAAPLLAAGAPLRRWGAPANTHTRDTVVPLAGATVALVGIVYVTHVPAVFDLALRVGVLHLLEHLGYLTVAFAFWAVVLDVDVLPWRAGSGARLIATLSLGPLIGLLAAVLVSANRILYPSQDATLHDQRVGGSLMWVAPMACALGVAAWIFLDWARRGEGSGERPQTVLGGDEVGDGKIREGVGEAMGQVPPM